MGSRGERFDDVSGEFYPTIGDNRDIIAGTYPVCFRDCGDLRNPYTGDDARRADGSGSHANLHGIDTSVDQGLRSLCGGYIARDQFTMGKLLFVSRTASRTPFE
jgi:hypothetical protein